MASSCRASVDFELFGLRTLIPKNDKIRATILLYRGANIYEFNLKSQGRDLVFHHPRVRPSKPVLGTLQGIDNFWFGGIDEILPTAFYSTYRADDYPIIGELWAHSYDCSLTKEEPDEVTAYLKTDTTVSTFRVEKWVTIRGGESVLSVKTKITNTGYMDFDFLLGVPLYICGQHRPRD